MLDSCWATDRNSNSVQALTPLWKRLERRLLQLFSDNLAVVLDLSILQEHNIRTLSKNTRGSAHWACIAHLTIEWYWSKFQREIIITLKNSSHLEWRVGLSDTILKGTHPGTIYAKFGSIWPSCFRGEDFFNISQSEKRIILGVHVYRPNGTKWRNFIEDLT